MIDHAIRTISTVGYLRPIQVIDQIVRKIRPFNRIPELAGNYQLVSRPPQPPVSRGKKCADGYFFCFLNKRKQFEGPERWHPKDVSLLWIYNLHYFQYIWEVSEATGRSLILDWIEVNQDPQSPAWHPYVLSIRIREWLEWLVAKPDLAGKDRCLIVRSLIAQIEALRQQAEYHLLGNHILENGVTLCWAGLSLNGPMSGEWIDTGLNILRMELGRQVLTDGAHEERSPMYQALIVEGLLRLALLAGSAESCSAAEVALLAENAGKRLFKSLGYFVHPDGDYALINDCALGVAPVYADLQSHFHLNVDNIDKISVWELPTAGYFGFRNWEGDYLLFDAGPLGPNHQPGHGHADLLSFEMSLNGRRVFTDSGVNTYEKGLDRDYHRGTSAHNTISFNGQNQAELWAAFRCGRRPSISEGRYDSQSNSFIGEYVGFRRETHRREIGLPGARYTFSDRVFCKGKNRIQWHLHLSPELDLASISNGWVVKDGDSSLAVILQDDFISYQRWSKFYPEFGVEQERQCLHANLHVTNSMSLSWGIAKASGKIE
ncbi:MAG: hypothetical protein GY861_05175 [bacterium]|nr:hypothetical protein [bacterium]